MTRTLTLSTLLVIALGTAARPANLAPDPGLERFAAEATSAWAPLTMGSPARFSDDEDTVHGGKRSVRIDADEVTRTYLRSTPIPVAPGEALLVSAWAKIQHVPADKGTVILIAEFVRASAKGEVAKVATAAKDVDGWQHLSGKVVVPAGCDGLRLRMGFSYSKGTVWWDDVEVRAVEPLVARIGETRLYPADQRIAVELLNREGRRGVVRIAATLGNAPFAQDVSLTGEPVQQAHVPARIRKRGNSPAALRLLEPGTEAELWAGQPMTVTVPPAVVLSPPSPTHWVTEDGEPRIEGELELSLDDGGPDGCSVQLSVADTDGKPLFERVLERAPAGGLKPFSLSLPALPTGNYRLIAKVVGDTGEPVTAEQPWSIIRRSAASTRLNPQGFLEKNGAAIFPLGMFNNEAKLKEEIEAGFNIVHFYNAARVQAGRKPDDQRLSDAMNRCEAAGAHVLLMVPLQFAFEGEWEAFRRRIRMFRNHPALLAWDEEEGIARGDMGIDGLRRMRQIVREEDPHHPFMVGDANDVINRVADRRRMFPSDEMDLGMWWWYPFPLRESDGDELQGEQASGGSVLSPPLFLAEALTPKPIWVGVQAYKKPTADGRYPTPVEYRAQAYLGIIHGAKGLMWYGGSVTGGTFLKPEEARWGDLKKLVRELRDLEPLLMGAAAPPPAVKPTHAPISAAIKRSSDRSILIAVNRGPDTIDVEFTIEGLDDDPLPVIGESRRISPKAGVLGDRFEPYGTHVYELTR